MRIIAYCRLASALDPKRMETKDSPRTKCWTEAPVGSFRNGSRVCGGSVNIGVELNRIAFAFERFGELDFSVSWQDVHSLAAYSD